MTPEEKEELKKLIHEVLDERFGCQHSWVRDDKDSAYRRCTKCNRLDYDAIFQQFLKENKL